MKQRFLKKYILIVDARDLEYFGENFDENKNCRESRKMNEMKESQRCARKTSGMKLNNLKKKVLSQKIITKR